MKLSSREYKLTLHAPEFAGDEAAYRSKAADFWTDTVNRLGETGIGASGKLNLLEPDKQRNVFFLDTPDKALYERSDLVFRMRRPVAAKGDWDATLKFRHGDRLLAGAPAFRLREGRGRGKFEEDVKAVPRSGMPGFWALFSRSVEAAFGPRKKLLTIGDCLAPFEKLDSASLPPLKEKVQTVSGLKVIEHVFEDGWLNLSKKVEAECALILWWKEDKALEPIAAEFSFRFALDDGEADAKVVRNAWTAMTALSGSPFIDPKGRTKTALVYGAD
ncbi:hypothetical protein [Neorhizobium galegae]|uniref:hypothetical protein n=1 Tax=Neorhizobium galegae TaxID=399 RepID=UPI00062280DB|nr:hypothetical protein [Neorhizobium galegae]CDZ47742.1 Hypothetical protein NGAL_HAMBI2427_23260 [Neorhizobium galegae bv. orientalis]